MRAPIATATYVKSRQKQAAPAAADFPSGYDAASDLKATRNRPIFDLRASTTIGFLMKLEDILREWNRIEKL